jgi:hypothetical protein
MTSGKILIVVSTNAHACGPVGSANFDSIMADYIPSGPVAPQLQPQPAVKPPPITRPRSSLTTSEYFEGLT